MACAGKRACRVNDTSRLGVGRRGASRWETRRSPGRLHVWRRAWRSRSAQVRECEVRPVARCVLGDQGSGAPSPATACVKYPTTARPWRLGQPIRGGEAVRLKKKGLMVQPRLRVGVRTCWGARWPRALRPRGHARERERERTGAGSRTRAARRGARRREGQAKSQRRARVDEGSGTWHDGRHH
jgi:hypothetical protein